MNSCQSSSDFLSIYRAENDGIWVLDVEPHLCSGRGDLWGGVGLAAALDAMVKETDGRKVVWATAQFLSNKNAATSLSIKTEKLTSTRNTSQYAARGKLDDVNFLNVMACLGERTGTVFNDLPIAPQVPPPDDCPEVFLGSPRTAMHQNTDVRLADGLFGVTGQGNVNKSKTLVMWMRMIDVENDAGSLTILSDYLLSGVGAAIGQQALGISLDNSIRFAQVVPTDWVLCEVTMEHIGNGFGYGSAHLWSQDKVLMATGSQSVIVKIPEIG